MSGARTAWVLAGVLLLGLGVAAVLRLRRRRTAARPGSREEALEAARHASRQIARDVRRTRRGTIRGKGGGGNDGLAIDAGITSDGGPGSV
ncbi:hypothetical protein ACFY2R_11265 [Micromonospora olivasterospora]|uniref:hypothetical protein n=1 Tax=Micromonospora olivasterospora TaxID=1880 RepID=UPI00119D8549|nr:hypothetical protein [Micromonospora olivasterospora]